VFVGIAVFLGIGLTKDPRLVPSPLVGKPVPQFDLPPVQLTFRASVSDFFLILGFRNALY
jgi:cytochrome c biogenesis protein CcmG/thiol:disulfide interchange protein DsbE